MEIGNKAPAGGAVSKVNGQEYKGGEFMPVTGEYCGQGRNRVSKSMLAAANAGAVGGRIEWSERFAVFQILVKVTAADGTTWEQVQHSGVNMAPLAKILARHYR